MREIANLKRVADEFRGEDTGTLSIATTHTQARYVLPKVLREFATRYPKVKVVLHQGNPVQVAEQTAQRRSRHRHRHRGAGRFPGARHAALLRVEPRGASRPSAIRLRR